MKRTIFLFTAIILSISASAQIEDAITTALESTPNMEVESDLLKFNKKTEKGFFVYINAERGVAEKKWKNFLEENYMAEFKKNKDVHTAMNVSIPAISSTMLNISYYVEDDENGSKMSVFYDMNGKYVNPKEHPTETGGVQSVMKNFQQQLYIEVYEDVLSDQRKEQDHERKSLEKLEKEKEGLEKDIANEEKDINDAQANIIDAEKKITELQAEMKSLQGEIDESKSTIKELKEAKAKKAEEINNQKVAVDTKTARIERLKSSADSISN